MQKQILSNFVAGYKRNGFKGMKSQKTQLARRESIQMHSFSPNHGS